MKAKKQSELLEGLDIVLEYGYGRHKGRHVRFLSSCGIFEVGEDDSTFDRWANSVELRFDIATKKGQREFIRWCSA